MNMGKTKSKKTAVPQKSKLKKDPGVPKLPEIKLRLKDQKRLKAAQNISLAVANPPSSDAQMASEPTLSTLALLAAEAESTSLSNDPESSADALDHQQRQNQRTFVRTLHKVIDESDLIILVLDARDPEGCRSRLVEEEVLRREAEGKRLVFVLNKIDLIPKENAQAWLKYLRHTVPTLPFRSTNTFQSQGAAPAANTAPALLKLLKSYRASSSRSVTIGIVGFPNVGKSSLINALKKSKVCSTSSVPGHTKSLQSVQLERGIKILDSPGVVWFEESSDSKGVSKKSSLLLRNVVKVELIEDPIAVVEQILDRTRASALRNIYKLPPPDESVVQDEDMVDEKDEDRWKDTLEFLTMVALSTGRLLKGGTPDLLTAAKQVIQDWNNHKIPFWSTPPAIHPSMIASSSNDVAAGAESIGNASIQANFAPAFKLEGLFNSADASALGGVADVEMEEDDDDNEVFYDAMEEEIPEPTLDNDMITDETFSLAALTSRKRARSPSVDESSSNQLDSLPGYVSRQPKRQRKQVDRDGSGGVVMNPLSRKSLKKDAKRARKAWRKTNVVEDGGMEVDDMLAETFMV